jgi:hypothetical protein
MCGVSKVKARNQRQNRKRPNMKKLTYPLIAAVAGLVIVSANPAQAGENSSCCTGSCCNKSIAASPKVRAMLDERCRSKCAPPDHTMVSTVKPQTSFAASPKAQQMNSKGAPATVIQVASETAGYQPTGSDGITASPKVRAMLNERSQAVQIAPLK